MTIDVARDVAGADPLPAIQHAIRSAQHDLRPVPADPAARGAWKVAIDEELRKLALKIVPTMSAEQGQPWRDVMLDVFADLPAMVALTAIQRALHRPMQFINQVETIVREIAAEIIVERNTVLRRLEAMRNEITRAMQARPAIAVRPDADTPTPEEIRAMSPAMRRMGLSLGSLTQADIDDALAIVADRVAPPRAAPADTVPTVAAYRVLGMSEDDAAQAVADHERMMRRGARPVGVTASAVLDDASNGDVRAAA